MLGLINSCRYHSTACLGQHLCANGEDSTIAEAASTAMATADPRSTEVTDLLIGSSPRKAARQQLSEQPASRAKAVLSRGQGAQGAVGDMHTPKQAAASLLDDKWMGAGASDGLRRDKRRPVLAQVDRRLFGRILFSFDTMPHHLPDTYLTALQEL